MKKKTGGGGKYSPPHRDRVKENLPIFVKMKPPFTFL